MIEGLNLNPGETFTQYEICGFIFRIGPPRLAFKESRDGITCRVECEMETISPALAPVPPQEGRGAAKPGERSEPEKKED